MINHSNKMVSRWGSVRSGSMQQCTGTNTSQHPVTEPQKPLASPAQLHIEDMRVPPRPADCCAHKNALARCKGLPASGLPESVSGCVLQLALPRTLRALQSLEHPPPGNCADARNQSRRRRKSVGLHSPRRLNKQAHCFQADCVQQAKTLEIAFLACVCGSGPHLACLSPSCGAKRVL